MTEPFVLIGLPTYGQTTFTGVMDAMFLTGYPKFAYKRGDISLLAFNFNVLVSEAWNERAEKGYTHFCMMHSDIGPGKDWLKTMLDIMAEKNFDVLSVVVPIKNNTGLTSTAVDTDSMPTPLTLTQVHNELPVTFTGEDTKRVYGNDRLLINTGLLLIRMDAIAPPDFYFEIVDRINVEKDGKFKPRNIPEDWHFSRMLYRKKVRYAATRAVEVRHLGAMVFNNQSVWGMANHERLPRLPEQGRVAS